MKADLTRVSFDPLKHFSAVLMQQGRVQLDADWNEQAAILLHLVRRLAADVYPTGGGSGFVPSALDSNVNDFAISPGTFYADGVLVELESTPVSVLESNAKDRTIKVAAWTVDGVPYQKGQRLELTDDTPGHFVQAFGQIAAVDYAHTTLTLEPGINLKKFPDFKAIRVRRMTTYRSQPIAPDAAAFAIGLHQAYLDVWEQTVTSLQDDSIREVALDGPDTAARTRVVWRIGMIPNTASADAHGRTPCMTPQAIANKLRFRGVPLLRAMTQPAPAAVDPCTVSPDARYRGPENQLYRVEIHGDAAHPPTFKWSRECGSAVFPIVALDSAGGATVAVLGNLGRDDRFGLVKDDYVEFEDDRSALTHSAGALLRVQSVDRDRPSVTLSGSLPAAIDPALHPLLRRWDQRPGDPDQGGLKIADDGAAQIVADQWQNIEDGVQVKFSNVEAAVAGDYWLIPARVATGDVIWPQESGPDTTGKTVFHPVAKPPDGVEHHYAPLGVVDVTDQQALTVTPCAMFRESNIS